MTATLAVLAAAADPRPNLDLTGTWSFYPDVGDAALDAVTVPPQTITVPGAWQAQGFGPAGGTIPSANIGPGTSPAEYLRHNLMGRCLYVKTVAVPDSWRGQRIFLCVRRAYRYTDLTVNGRDMGGYEGFCTPFEFDVTDAIQFGGANRISLGVDNRPRPGRDTLGTANLNGNWGGLGGRVYLEARAAVWIGAALAVPHIGDSRVTFRLSVQSTDPAILARAQGQADVFAWSSVGPSDAVEGQGNGALPSLASNPIEFELPVKLARARLWSPSNPSLYLAKLKLIDRGRVLDEVAVRFGMREIRAEGTKLFLNNQPLYLSGYGDDATEPLTGMLPADKALYRQRLSLMRQLGFNFVRHHSCVPHDEYLEAADEAGMLVQPEAGMAYTGFWRTGHQLFEREWPQIVRAYANHPSVWAWCMGNELFLKELAERPTTPVSDSSAGTTVDRTRVLEMLGAAYRVAKQLDPSRLVHASDGGTPHEFTDILSNGSPERSLKPYLLHEYGTYCCSLPDLSLIPRLTGVIRPLTYERAEKYLRERQLLSVYPRLYRSSLLMRADAQKHYIEAAKAAGSNCGYSFWLGVDFPDSPEGCWDEGVLNQLWEPKPYLTNRLADLNGPTVLLTSVGLENRSFLMDQGKQVQIRLWHYGTEPIRGATLAWKIKEDGRVLKSGEVAHVACELGETKEVVGLKLDGLAGERPRFVTVEVDLTRNAQRITGNAWEFYAYPRSPVTQPRAGVYSEAGPLPGARPIDGPIPDDTRLLITRELTRDRHRDFLRRGKAAVLLLGNGGFKETKAGYFLNQYGTGFGGIIEEHPVFQGIPHEGRLHCGLYQLVAGGGVLETEEMPAALREGSIVWGLRLTGWISPVKNLRRVTQFSEVVCDNELHFVLCDLDLLTDKPESRYVLGRAIDYLTAGSKNLPSKTCAVSDLETLLR